MAARDLNHPQQRTDLYVIRDVSAVEQPDWWEKNRRSVFEVLKIIQICVCLFFVSTGIILSLLNIFSANPNWYSWPFWGNPYQSKCYHIRCNFWYEFWYFYWYYSLWIVVLISICGLIGGAGEVLWCQAVYAIMCTLFLTVYSFLPWAIVVGIVQKWSVPYYRQHPYYVRHY